MGSADYFYKIKDAKTAIIIEAKQELDKTKIKNLSSNTNEALFTADDLSTDVSKTNLYIINNKKIKKYLSKKIKDYDKYESYTNKIINILNDFIDRFSSSEVNGKEENIKKFIIEPMLDILNFNKGSLEHGVENDTYKTPQEQILAYLQAQEFQEYKVYGILTSGLVWKLYYKDKNGKISKEPLLSFNFALLLDEQITKKEKNKVIAYFVEIFTFHNLLANEKNYKCSLVDNLLEIDDCIYAESLELSERLFKNIIDKGYIELAKGIAVSSKKQNINLTSKQLEQYSMKILFRLIFVLYSEARGFLPLNQTTYYSRYSLEKIAIQLGKNKDKQTPIEDDLWARINDLFRTIDNGKMGGNIKIPVYNGGLFREFKDDILNKIFIENRYMSDVLFSLIYHEKKVTYDRIDYNLLDVKYIGTVYEKLLDYKIVKDGKNYRLKQKGDNNVRKGLGAYYTPDNVTKYIIKNAVDKKIELFKDEFDEKYNSLGLSELYKLQDYCVYKKLLELKIIDISCGSGHFLIDTIEYLADICVDLQDFYLKYVHFKSDKVQEIEYQREIINNNSEFIESSLQKATFRDVCKRYVLKHCIYGMDINPLATDITKFAIWLETFIVGIPLSFMDNHIKYGNSVLGFIDNVYDDININDLVIRKDNLFFNEMVDVISSKKNEILNVIKDVNGLIEEINSNIDVSTKEIEINYASYSKVDARVQYLKYNLIPLSFLYHILQNKSILKTINSKSNKLILDKLLETLIDAISFTKWTDYVETYFIYFKKPEILYEKLEKHKIKKDFFAEMLQLISSKREQTSNKLSKILDNIFEFEYTNWFLEFPNTKFDIVLGNPPYVRADTDGEFAQQRDIILNNFDYETLYEKWDLMMAFVERNFKLLKDDGILSLIIKDDYLKAKYASKSREYFSQNARINRIDFLSDIQVFSGVGVKNIILEYQKTAILEHEPLRLKHNEEFENIQKLDTKKQLLLKENIFNENIQEKTVYQDCIEWGDIFYLSKSMVLQSDEKKAKGLFTKDNLISLSKDAIHQKEYIEGKDIKSYEIERIRYLEWDTERCPKLVSRATFPKLYIFPKIMMGSMTSGIYDESGLVANHSVTISTKWKNLHATDNKSISMSIQKDYKIKGKEIIQEKRYELEANSDLFLDKYCLAVLNSTFAKDFFNLIKRSSIGLYPDDIKKLPIKIIKIEDQQKFVDIVDEIMNKKSSTLKEDTKELEETLDIIVKKLYERE